MGIDDCLVNAYALSIAKIPEMQYPIESKVGQVLDGTAMALSAIKNEDLSPEMIEQRDLLFTKITSEMLKGYNR